VTLADKKTDQLTKPALIAHFASRFKCRRPYLRLWVSDGHVDGLPNVTGSSLAETSKQLDANTRLILFLEGCHHRLIDTLTR